MIGDIVRNERPAAVKPMKYRINIDIDWNQRFENPAVAAAEANKFMAQLPALPTCADVKISVGEAYDQNSD